MALQNNQAQQDYINLLKEQIAQSERDLQAIKEQAERDKQARQAAKP